ncbi:hypothetical protein ACEPAF_6256 [Sanghuangporus sanghuang]
MTHYTSTFRLRSAVRTALADSVSSATHHHHHHYSPRVFAFACAFAAPKHTVNRCDARGQTAGCICPNRQDASEAKLTLPINITPPPLLYKSPPVLLFSSRMLRPPNTFNSPASSFSPSSSCPRKSSPPSTMSSDARERASADRGAAPFPLQATVPVIVTDSNGDASLSATANAAVHFASVAHDRDLPLHSSPIFASASPDTEDSEMRFEQELADVGMAEYFAFDALNSSSPFMTNNSPVPAAGIIGINASSPTHASPPPLSDADGASPALSDSNSNFGFGSPSTTSWSASNLQLPDVTNTSPRSPPLYSPTYDHPVFDHGPGLAFADRNSDGARGALFASPHGYGYDYSMTGPDASMSFETNPCADTSGLGLGFAPHAETMSTWDTFGLPSSQPQSYTQPQTQQLPKLDFESHSPTTPHQQNDIQQVQGQDQSLEDQMLRDHQHAFLLPSGAIDVPMRPRLAPSSSPAISPRDLELHSPAGASIGKNTPAWAKGLFDPTGTSTSLGLLGEHCRSVSETSVFGRKTHGQAFEFVPPQSTSAAIPIPIASGANSNGGMTTDFHPYGHSLTQIFQPASAPAQPHSGFAFMTPMEPSPFPESAFGNAFNVGAEASPRFTASGNGNKAGNGNGGGIRARMRSVSQRLGSGWRDSQRTFSTRASAGFAQGQVPYQRPQLEGSGRDKLQLKAEEERLWNASLGLPTGAGMYADEDTSINANLQRNEDNMATVRVAFPRLRSSTSSSSLGVDLSEGDPDATVRRRKRTSKAQTPSPSLRPSALSPGREKSRELSLDPPSPSRSSREDMPQRSELRPPKLAPSTWQLYFTDWIQRHQMNNGDRKLNVAQAAKEAGAEYARLTSEEKEPFKRRSQALKEARERELSAWQRTLTPEDIKRENAFRTAQRRAGKSRKGNIKDPNAPKKPLSAYFMFLQHIRADPERVRSVFGDERETTAQSVLAAQTWREMTDEERKPFLAQAEKEKLAYEAARRLYEEGTVGFETTISFNTDDSSSASGSSSMYPSTTFVIGTPAHDMGMSSDSELEMGTDSEECTTDDERAASRRKRRM